MKKFVVGALLAVFFVGGFVSNPAVVMAETQASPEEELFFVAQKAFDDGFYDVAIRYIEQFLQKFPATEHYAQARLLCGQCYFFKNQYLTALDIFQELYENKQLPDATLYWLGETYFKGSDYHKAQEFYKKVIKSYPDSQYAAQANYSLGWSFFEQGEYAQAVVYFRNVVESFQDQPFHEDALFKLAESQLNLSQYSGAILSFEQYIHHYPQSSRIANAMFYLAESCYYANDLLKANTYYAKAAELADEPQVTFMSKVGMGWIYLKLKKYQLAEAYFSQAKTLAQKHSLSEEDVLLGQGALFSETERYQQAREVYNVFIARFPDNIHFLESLIGKANASYLLQDYGDAIATYQSILSYEDESHPLSPEVKEKTFYGIAWAYLKQGDVQRAIQTFETIIATASSDTVKASALSQVGDAYQETNQLEQALAAYDRILNAFSETLYADYAQFQQGITLLKMGETEAANASFQSLKTNFQDSEYCVEADYYLGFVHFQQQKWTQAIYDIQNFLEHSRKKDFFMNQAQYILALSYFQTQDYQQALQLFHKILADLTSQPSIQQTSEIFIGKCLAALQKPDEAINQFQHIIQSYPQTEAHQDALLWLGSFYLEKLDFSTAVPFYQDFIRIFPSGAKVAIAFYELGQCFMGLDQLDQALNSFKQVPDDADPEIFAKAKLAVAEIFSKEFGPEVALEKYRQIAENVPAYKRDALMKIAKIYEVSKNFKAAIATYQQALKSERALSDISNAELLFEIADKYEVLNEYDKAVEEYFKIPYLEKDELAWTVRAYLRVGRIFDDREDWDQAKLTYSKILELDVEESKYAQERLDWIEQLNRPKN